MSPDFRTSRSTVGPSPGWRLETPDSLRPAATPPQLIEPTPVLYEMWRTYDFSGVSGRGRVAHVTAYPGGKATLAWCATGECSIGVYDSVEQLMRIHGHNGSTRLVRIFPSPENDRLLGDA